jgi:hypothetical protein
MGNYAYIIIGLLVGVGIAFFISQIFTDGGYAACLIILLIVLAIGGEFLPIIRKVPDIERPWSHMRFQDDENNRETSNHP